MTANHGRIDLRRTSLRKKAARPTVWLSLCGLAATACAAGQSSVVRAPEPTTAPAATSPSNAAPAQPATPALAAPSSAAHAAAPATSTPAPADSPAPRFRSPKEITEIVEASPVAYNIKALKPEELPGDILSVYWPEVRGRFDYPHVRKTSTGTVLEEWAVKPEIADAIRRAEEYFVKGNLNEADKLYENAAALDPTYGQPLVFRGDCAFGKKDFAKAIAFYDRAIALNPMDFRARMFKADALVHQGKPAEARDVLATALVLAPRYENLLRIVQAYSAPLKVTVQPDLLGPQALVRKSDRGVDVSVVANGPSAAHWLAWGLCKAVWLVEEAHRKEMTGSAEHRFTSTEELECLGGLLSTYEQMRAQSGADPFLERLVAIADDGLMGAFVIYELASRVDPHVTLTLPEEARAAMKQYVLKYVLSAGELPAASAAKVE